MRVRVLGAGVVGLACAEELVRRGHEVEVVDPAPGGGASYAAAGMLAPTAEVWHGEEALLDLGLRSLALWPEAARRWGVALRTGGTLLVGRDDADLQQVERQAALLARLGRPVEVVGGRAARGLEPRLGPGVAGAALLPEEGSVSPREVVAAMLDRHRARLFPAPSAAPVDRTVVATGIAATGLVRGVRGEILRLRSDDPPERTVRGWVHGEPVYVVPRAGGEVVVGATSEEHDAPAVVTAGGVRRLLEAACRLLPGLDRAELLEATARDRPATLDNLPLVGPAGPGWSDGRPRDDGGDGSGGGGDGSDGSSAGGGSAGEGAGDDTVLAVGLFRHGVLLAPLVAALVADHLEHGHVEPALDPRRLDPRRPDPRRLDPRRLDPHCPDPHRPDPPGSSPDALRRADGAPDPRRAGGESAPRRSDGESDPRRGDSESDPSRADPHRPDPLGPPPAAPRRADGEPAPSRADRESSPTRPGADRARPVPDPPHPPAGRRPAMTHVVLNGEAHSLDDTATLAELVSPDRHGRGCAVALNGVVVPRAQLAAQRLTDGDVVEVVTAVQGG